MRSEPKSEGSRMKTILIIDDCSDTRQLVNDLLTESNFHVESASSVKEAFDKLAIDNYDLIICDIHLPFSLGSDHFDYGYSYEVGVRTIQQLKWVSPDQPILAITATAPWDLPTVMREISDIPVLSKPLGHRALLSKVSELTSSVGSCALTETERTVPPLN